jgi:voltage-gated potassium channel
MPAVSFRHAVHEVLDSDRPVTDSRAFVRRGIALLIVLNIAAVVLETVPGLRERHARAFHAFEAVSIAVFVVEYLLRLWAAPEARLGGAAASRARWLLSPAALVDLLAILPSLLPAGGVDLRSLRALRLLRIARVARLGRYSVAVQTLWRVLRTKRADLVSLLFLLLVLVVLTSTVVYWLEHDAQPAVFSSIPATMWWSIVTLTTVGYGDMAPMTGAGRVVGGISAILGIGMFALPAGLLGAAFVDEIGKARTAGQDGDAGHGAAADATCRHCGKPLG